MTYLSEDDLVKIVRVWGEFIEEVTKLTENYKKFTQQYTKVLELLEMKDSGLQVRDSGKIIVFNVPKGCCVYEFCGTHATYFVNLDLAGFRVQLVFCKKHYLEFQKILEKKI